MQKDTQKEPQKTNKTNIDSEPSASIPASDPINSGITDIGARRIMGFAYTEFMKTLPEKGAYFNMRAACIYTEEQNFQFAIKNLGRQNANRLEEMMKSVQEKGYGDSNADQFYLRWSAKVAKNKKQNMASPRAKDDKFKESYSEAYDEAVKKNNSQDDLTGFSYELSQDTLNQFQEKQIELYFVHPGLRGEDIESMKSQKAEAVGLPCLIVTGCTMDKNLAKVAAGEGGVVFTRKFDKTQIVGGYSLSVGFNVDGAYEFEKEILVLADDADGPDDAKLIFELSEGEVEIVTPEEEQAAEAEEDADDADDEEEKPAQQNKPTQPAQKAPQKPQAAPINQTAQKPQTPQKPMKESENDQEPAESVKFTVEKSQYGMLASVEGGEIPEDWIKKLRETPEGKKLIKNSQKKVQKAIEQNKKLAEHLKDVPEGEDEEEGQEKPEKPVK